VNLVAAERKLKALPLSCLLLSRRTRCCSIQPTAKASAAPLTSALPRSLTFFVNGPSPGHKSMTKHATTNALPTMTGA
jgi:hypothetical protein